MGFGSYLRRAGRWIIKGVPEYNLKVSVSTTSPSDRLEGRGVLITGGSRGLGFSVAQRCIDEGARVVITGRTESSLTEAAEKLGFNCNYIVHDARDVDNLTKLLDEAEALTGCNCLYGLVSNAGVSLHEDDFRNVTPEGWDKQVDTNLKGNYFLVKEFVERLEGRGAEKGNIVVISSERARRSDDIPYGLTKAATDSFVRCMATRVIDKDIRINGVAPGVTASDMTGVSRDGNMYANWQPANRFFLPEEVAEVVAFLLSDASNCISGEVIACDQGRYISTW